MGRRNRERVDLGQLWRPLLAIIVGAPSLSTAPDLPEIHNSRFEFYFSSCPDSQSPEMNIHQRKTLILGEAETLTAPL